MKFSPLCLGLLVLSAVACKQDRKIKEYRVAKDSLSASQPSPASDPHAGLPGMTPQAMPPISPGADPHAGLTAGQLAVGGQSVSPPFSDTPPAHWKKQALSPMRLASYQVQGEGDATVDISFSILRRAPGSTLANVNRWRNQLGQPPIDDAALEQTAQTVKTSFGQGIAVEIEGLAPGANAAKDGGMIGVIADKDNDAWFFKMRGNAALTANEKEHFIAWVQTVAPAATPNPSPSALTTPAAPPEPAEKIRLTWEIPSGWTLVPATSAMRYATMSVVGAQGVKGELIVSHFLGDVGGDLENVNRWRQQVGAAPVDQAGLAAQITQLTAGPKSFSLVDVTGPQNRLTAGWTRHGADSWFFKLVGPDALVGAEKARFTAFLESVRFTLPE